MTPIISTAPPYPVYLSREIRAIERQAAGQRLMERAGQAIAELAQQWLDNGDKLLIIAGPGNNGGDALVAARCLKAEWYTVSVVFTGDPAQLSMDAAGALTQWQASGGQLLTEIPANTSWGLIIDGLFGIGLERDLSGRYAGLVAQINSLGAPILSIDIPSGLCSDTGRVRGVAVKAAATLTFIGLKPGLLTLDGPDYRGELRLEPLGIDPQQSPPGAGRLLTRPAVAGLLPRRAANTHKGRFGSVGVLGGAESMTGAALLAGRAALKCGAGKVVLGLLAANAPGEDLIQPELMLYPPQALIHLSDLSCLVIGPGLGQSELALRLLEGRLESSIPLVLDADALNLVAQFPMLQEGLRRRRRTILTPHPAEAARLLGVATADVQQARIESALTLAKSLEATVVLKGAGSVCALPDGRWRINTSGNPGMSGAGMGDVLAGMIGALLAQGLDTEQATLLAVFLHGAAADRLVAQGNGPVGLTAGEVIDAARALLNQWTDYPGAC
ncbi:MAG TPA: bifunctional ADP-dependent NAD(P)H-hydrate dehydratase/NAD(P)H-hydrate epimerase [Betaproteobacteria bacterium]|nr:bifunctional ADP-dependent NAD(P)H-hydrate dehydratase/NAD(P)H-hydrate epimerase [Betaproteobacteria bacterium]